MSVMVNSLTQYCLATNLGIYKMFVGTYMSSIDMKGFSITLFDLYGIEDT